MSFGRERFGNPETSQAHHDNCGDVGGQRNQIDEIEYAQSKLKVGVYIAIGRPFFSEQIVGGKPFGKPFNINEFEETEEDEEAGHAIAEERFPLEGMVDKLTQTDGAG